jgi:hypothetical protein
LGALDEIRDGDGSWPPEDHADRIETQEDHQILYRNRRHELVQRWSADLLRYAGRQEDLIPYPSAKIAARTLAAFLFGEDPEITHDDRVVADALKRLSAAQALPSRLLEGAITQGVQGEVYLRPAWDADLSPWAILTSIPGRQVLPTFRFGMLVDATIVTTWEPVAKGDQIYYRLLEQHERGRIRYALFRGRADRIGRPVPLDDERAPQAAREVARTVTQGADLEGITETGIDELLVVHVPLGRDGESPHGVSLFDGLESLVLGMHRLYSQEQHDAELARRRIAVPETLLGRDRSGRPVFDRSVDLFPLTEDALGAVGDEGKAVQPIEFSDDNVQRERIAGRLRDFLVAVGIAPDTLDAQEAGGAISGTSRRLAQAMTIQTASAAGRYWQDALSRATALALMVSEIHLGAQGLISGLEELPSVSLADGLVDDPVELARILGELDTAEAISTLEKVRRLHPEWSPEQIDDEVKRILARSPDAPPAPPVAPFGPSSGQDAPLRAVGDDG